MTVQAGVGEAHVELLAFSVDENALAATQKTRKLDGDTGNEIVRASAVQSKIDQKLSSERRVPAVLVIYFALLGGTVSG